MKIYLLIMLIGSLLAAIHFASAPKQGPERFRNSVLFEEWACEPPLRVRERQAPVPGQSPPAPSRLARLTRH